VFKRFFNSLQGNAGSSDPNALLKRATTLKREGNLDAAIQTLRQAYGQIAKEQMTYGVDPFLRLPLYLQEAHRNDEAWAEFNRLIVEGYPNQLRDQGVRSMEHSKVYDKMRLFLQRDGKNDQAIVFGVLSMLARAKGLNLQKRSDEFKEFTSQKSVEANLKPLLKKAGLAAHSGQFVELMRSELEAPSSIDLAGAIKRMGELVAQLRSTQ
jgi:hypothetical protein